MDLVLKDDRQGLMELKYGIDPERFNQLNAET